VPGEVFLPTAPEPVPPVSAVSAVTLVDAVRTTAASFAAAASTASGDSSVHTAAPPTETPPTYGLGDGIPGSATASLTSGGTGPTSARLDDRSGSPTFVLLFRSALVDDDLPGAPLFTTDVSPD
jgi:hypothetical protein